MGYIRVCVYTRIYVYMCVCVSIYIYVYIYVSICFNSNFLIYISYKR